MWPPTGHCLGSKPVPASYSLGGFECVPQLLRFLSCERGMEIIVHASDFKGNH